MGTENLMFDWLAAMIPSSDMEKMMLKIPRNFQIYLSNSA